MDQTITCKGCGTEFVFTEREQAFYKDKGLRDPQNCKECRAKRKQEWANRQGSGGGNRSGQ